MEGAGAGFRKRTRSSVLPAAPLCHSELALHPCPEKELVSKLLHLHFKDAKTKVSGDALQLMVELLKIFVVEAAVRGIRQAQAEDVPLVGVDQLEKVLPQLLLDF
ncbi:centromere protein X isoform X1 [Eulemur rufifrons]|uniref:centromere protein X isoform X1 n=1 Tax=Eulemur rufifrons TaxID=859984 RepID=UPI003743A933